MFKTRVGVRFAQKRKLVKTRRIIRRLDKQLSVLSDFNRIFDSQLTAIDDFGTFVQISDYIIEPKTFGNIQHIKLVLKLYQTYCDFCGISNTVPRDIIDLIDIVEVMMLLEGKRT